jgi:hypothetical protein
LPVRVSAREKLGVALKRNYVSEKFTANLGSAQSQKK